jgi:hypothetical protein
VRRFELLSNERELPIRVKGEIGLTLLSGMLFLLTIAWPEWIEGLFKVSPDAGSGWVEWAISGILLVVTAIVAFSAGLDYRLATSAEV